MWRELGPEGSLQNYVSKGSTTCDLIFFAEDALLYGGSTLYKYSIVLFQIFSTREVLNFSASMPNILKFETFRLCYMAAALLETFPIYGRTCQFETFVLPCVFCFLCFFFFGCGWSMEERKGKEKIDEIEEDGFTRHCRLLAKKIIWFLLFYYYF